MLQFSLCYPHCPHWCTSGEEHTFVDLEILSRLFSKKGGCSYLDNIEAQWHCHYGKEMVPSWLFPACHMLSVHTNTG